MRIAQLEAWPLYAQVCIEDPGTVDVQLWETGEERVVATLHSLAVSTPDDCKEPIPIEVWTNELDVKDIELSDPVFDGFLELSTACAMVGNSIAHDLESVELSSGRHRVRVYTVPRDDRAERVYFLVD